jgi:drug/metabolite transporter (DMT)-like permease
LPLTAIQLWVIAIVSLIWGAPDLLREQEVIGTNLGVILYLGLFDTAATIVLQVLAQRWVNAYETALMYTLEPIFAAVFSFLILGEQLGIRGLIGATFVLVAMIFGQTKSQETEQNGGIEVKETIDTLLSSSDTGPVNVPVSFPNGNLIRSR